MSHMEYSGVAHSALHEQIATLRARVRDSEHQVETLKVRSASLLVAFVWA